MSSRLISLVFVYCLSNISTLAFGQAPQPPEKPKFGISNCRADVQKWTYDPFDKTLGVKFVTGTAFPVNGQLRIIPPLSYGATVLMLQKRIYELSVCTHEDADFEKQFGTYSFMERSYQEERTFRYMSFIEMHNLSSEFIKEDAEEFK